MDLALNNHESNLLRIHNAILNAVHWDIKLTIPFAIKSKKAVQFGKGHAYSINKDEEASIRLIASNYMRVHNIKIIPSACLIYIVVAFRPPLKLKGLKELPPMDKVPDFDNLAKQAMDGVKKACFVDDRLAIFGGVSKIYAEKEYTQIYIAKY